MRTEHLVLPFLRLFFPSIKKVTLGLRFEILILRERKVEKQSTTRVASVAMNKIYDRRARNVLTSVVKQRASGETGYETKATCHGSGLLGVPLTWSLPFLFPFPHTQATSYSDSLSSMSINSCARLGVLLSLPVPHLPRPPHHVRQKRNTSILLTPSPQLARRRGGIDRR